MSLKYPLKAAVGRTLKFQKQIYFVVHCEMFYVFYFVFFL